MVLVLLQTKEQKAEVHCLDGRCYHAGAPLDLGDIEDVNGHTCIRCPWHSYKIDVGTGNRIVEHYPIDGSSVKYITKPGCQRKHSVQVEQQSGDIYVILHETIQTEKDEPIIIKSDYYARKQIGGSSSDDDDEGGLTQAGGSGQCKTITIKF